MDIGVKNVHRIAASAGQGTAGICISINSSMTAPTLGVFLSV